MNLRRACEDSSFPPVVAVHMATPENEQAFFERYWPEVRTVADPTRTLYEGFGLERATKKELMNPRYGLAAILSILKVGMGKPQKDSARKPGAFLVSGGEVKWSHPFRHFGDLPQKENIGGVYRSIR